MQIISHILEPLLESVPQVHILLCFWGIHPRLITGQNRISFYNLDSLFFATFLTSLVSAAKGIASFLLEGPCKLLPQKGLFGGMGTMGFIFLSLNITSTLLGKAFLLFISYEGIAYDFKDPNGKVILYWALFNLIPQLIMVR